MLDSQLRSDHLWAQLVVLPKFWWSIFGMVERAWLMSRQYCWWDVHGLSVGTESLCWTNNQRAERVTNTGVINTEKAGFKLRKEVRSHHAKYQLILNYCYGHRDSSSAFFPISQPVIFVNHLSKEDANEDIPLSSFCTTSWNGWILPRRTWIYGTWPVCCSMFLLPRTSHAGMTYCCMKEKN